MSRKISIAVSLLALCGLMACQEQKQLSSYSSIESSSSSRDSASLNSSSLESSQLEISSNNEIASSEISESSIGPISSEISSKDKTSVDREVMPSSEISSIGESSTSGETLPSSEVMPSSDATSSSENQEESDPLFSSTPSINSTYQPIDFSPEIDVFADEVTFKLDGNKISKEAAEELVSNDFSNLPKDQSVNKRTSIAYEKEESHVTENRSSATYSVKDLVKEKQTISKVDSDNKWSYSKNKTKTVTNYFVEDTLIYHSSMEHLYFVKDNYLYHVCSEESYYEGMEDKGTFESYYTKEEFLEEENYSGIFPTDFEGFAYFNSRRGFNRIERSVYTNLLWSSSFYTADDYNNVERDTNYEYYSSGEKGDFGCIVNDVGDYYFADLIDYPTMEKNSLSKISYHQDYLLNISDYFAFEEDYLTKSISKKDNDKVIRDETKQGRKKVTLECDIFYPDLSNLEEREITIPITK